MKATINREQWRGTLTVETGGIFDPAARDLFESVVMEALRAGLTVDMNRGGFRDWKKPPDPRVHRAR